LITRTLFVSILLAGMAGGLSPDTAHGTDIYWHVENLGGDEVDSRQADTPVNPASVVKLATTLCAVDRLGPDYRFVTSFGLSGGSAPRDGVLAVPLQIRGAHDPDFHDENAMLVARALNDIGIREIAGGLRLDGSFWIGWEGGSARRVTDMHARAAQMGQRLRQVWNPARWSAGQKAAWKAMAGRRGLDAAALPSVLVADRVALGSPEVGFEVLVDHRSEPLKYALRRFNVFSNNDIERLDASLGPHSKLSDFVSTFVDESTAKVRFETSSGLGTNRMTPRQIVRMLRELRARTNERPGLLADLLPVMGCGPSTLTKLFPNLRRSGQADGMLAKTGTLTTTDGGVAALAGVVPTVNGDLFFSVVVPRAGKDLWAARRAQEEWVEGLIRRHGGLRAIPCPAALPLSDTGAEVVVGASYRRLSSAQVADN
jgi:D-alanyl-D-alanine carboxypeptidase/D-alanyl-D-alanine-endopeptidase (penicillin-binding protein 4)